MLSKRLDRAVKLAAVLVGLLVVAMYAPVYYHTSEFNEFVRTETRHVRQRGELRQVIMTKAEDYRLPVREENINITMQDSVFRVAVDYRVPVNLILFRHELTFHAVGSRPILGN